MDKSLNYTRAAVMAGVVLAGCTQTRYVAVPVPDSAIVSPRVAPVLEACAKHAANAQKDLFGESFDGLQLDTSNLVISKADGKVGSQQVGAVLDGEGQWFGRPVGTMGEWRKVRFHCMVSPVGNVVYSFVRGE